MVNSLERDLTPQVSNPEGRERTLVDRIVPLDVTKKEGLKIILQIFQDPANRAHLVGITDQTTADDLIVYYTRPECHGFVGLSRQKGLVGVYDLTGPEEVIEPQIEKDKNNGQDSKLTVGSLNRLCVRSDLQKSGVGTYLANDAVRRAHYDYGWSNLLAGIILNQEVSQRIQSARREGDTAQEDALFEKLRLTDEEGGDARVRLFVNRLGFRKSGFFPHVVVGDQVREVLLIAHIIPELTRAPQ